MSEGHLILWTGTALYDPDSILITVLVQRDVKRTSVDVGRDVGDLVRLCRQKKK